MSSNNPARTARVARGAARDRSPGSPPLPLRDWKRAFALVDRLKAEYRGQSWFRGIRAFWDARRDEIRIEIEVLRSAAHAPLPAPLLGRAVHFRDVAPSPVLTPIRTPGSDADPNSRFGLAELPVRSKASSVHERRPRRGPPVGFRSPPRRARGATKRVRPARTTFSSAVTSPPRPRRTGTNMRTFPDIRMRELVERAQHAQKLLDDQHYDDARKAFVVARAQAKRLGLASAYLAWGVAVCSDYLGDTEMAFSTMTESLAQDPLNPAARHSFDIICGRLRAMLADTAREAADPATPRLYELLMSAGEADVPCHLAMARWFVASGKAADALRLLDAVTLLAPASRDAWLAKAALARSSGDEQEAARCEAQGAALASTAVAYGIPAPGAAC